MRSIKTHDGLARGTNILLTLLMARMINKITPEIAEEQCGFVKDKGTRNAIYIW